MSFYSRVLLGTATFTLIFLVLVADAQHNQQPVFDTNDGTIQGRLQYTLFHRKPYYAFKGIPYAQPPIGDLRFKPPQQAIPWNGVLDATNFGSICMQPYASDTSEDCLFLNIYMPANQPRLPMPVLIGIHGGGFAVGSSNDLGPDFLLNQENLIFVSMNYRLGPLGFMSLNSSEYSGNMGLKDQLLAIRWVNENIHHFGGDVERISLCGLSAGSASAHLHVLSPASQGLFQRAIMASGVASNPWAITFSDHIPVLTEFAELTGNPVQNDKELIDFLLNVDAHLFINGLTVQMYVPGAGRLEIDFFWAPVVEHPHAIEPFFLRSPSDILENDFHSDVDTLFGVTYAESYFIINEELLNTSKLAPFNERFEMQLPLYNLNDDIDFQSDHFRAAMSEVREFYFGHNGGTVNVSSLLPYSRLVSDLTFNYGIDHTVRIHAAQSTGKTYYYRFSATGIFNLVRWTTAAANLGLPGATHGDDMFYAFGTDGMLTDMYYLVPSSSNEIRVLNEYSKFYTNFIAYGDPTIGNQALQLEPVTVDTINFVDFQTNQMVVDRNLWSDRMQFWDDILRTHFL